MELRQEQVDRQLEADTRPLVADDPTFDGPTNKGIIRINAAKKIAKPKLVAALQDTFGDLFQSGDWELLGEGSVIS
eukprot:10700251-Karenia_brevis.AAC.1